MSIRLDNKSNNHATSAESAKICLKPLFPANLIANHLQYMDSRAGWQGLFWTFPFFGSQTDEVKNGLRTGSGRAPG
jgi:hypothetical protein